jgi:hypothetical protein
MRPTVHDYLCRPLQHDKAATTGAFRTGKFTDRVFRSTHVPRWPIQIRLGLHIIVPNDRNGLIHSQSWPGRGQVRVSDDVAPTCEAVVTQSNQVKFPI